VGVVLKEKPGFYPGFFILAGMGSAEDRVCYSQNPENAARPSLSALPERQF
jgi:hypothetical protein